MRFITLQLEGIDGEKRFCCQRLTQINAVAHGTRYFCNIIKVPLVSFPLHTTLKKAADVPSSAAFAIGAKCHLGDFLCSGHLGNIDGADNGTRSAEEAEGDKTMETIKIAEFARALLDAHGDKAEAEAAQKASALKAEGKVGEAEQWEKVRKTIHELRSGHVS